MRIDPGQQNMNVDEVSGWLARLGLTVTEGGQLLNLTDPHHAMRRMLTVKSPSPPTILLMETMEAIATALVCLRTGRTDDARKALEGCITPALKRTIRERAPGAEAVGAAPPSDSGGLAQKSL